MAPFLLPVFAGLLLLACACACGLSLPLIPSLCLQVDLQVGFLE